MANKERVNALLAKLKEEASLSTEEVLELQTHVDLLETTGGDSETHFHSHSTPHHTDFDTSTVDLVGFLERVISPKTRG